MTGNTGAPSTKVHHWKAIDWKKVAYQVRRLQLRIAKAIKMRRYKKAKALQWLLTHSFFAKLLAVKRVTTNTGKRTPGVDGIVWKTDKQKLTAAYALRSKGYKAQPLRRIYIPKKNGKLRPLGIPTKIDRAHQALYLLALEPVTEIQADTNSYGFRPKRSTQDAIEQCFTVLAQKSCAQWIMEGDIKACFDKISHEWLLGNIMMDKDVLKQWLKAGYMEKKVLHDTVEGSPQGGLASPSIANATLDGLEQIVTRGAKQKEKIHFVRYADDFICTASSKEILENRIKPAIINFLKERGLELSEEKTKITHIQDGFDFLGFNVRKYKEKLLIKPKRQSVNKFTEGLKETIKKLGNSSTASLIANLNSKIRGWANHYKSCIAKRAFSYIDNIVFKTILRMLKRKHPKKSKTWIRRKYFTKIEPKDWRFFCKVKNKNGILKQYTLIKAAHTVIRRHRKIKGRATPFDSDFEDYFIDREKRLKKERKNCRIVNNNLKGA